LIHVNWSGRLRRIDPVPSGNCVNDLGFGRWLDLAWLIWIKLRQQPGGQYAANFLEGSVSDKRASKPRRPKKEGPSAQRQTREKGKVWPDEELSPERRAELAEEIKAKRFRGTPPSI
jgi:hypothetical protein